RRSREHPPWLLGPLDAQVVAGVGGGGVAEHPDVAARGGDGAPDGHVDVEDAAGAAAASQGAARELQLHLDPVPLHRVLLLADRTSNIAYLSSLVCHAWARMAAGSANAGRPSPVAMFAMTGNEVLPDWPQFNRRRHSRRVAATALDIAGGRLAG